LRELPRRWRDLRREIDRLREHTGVVFGW
jgi:hypothetical protein